MKKALVKRNGKNPADGPPWYTETKIEWINNLSTSLTGDSFDKGGDVFFVHGVCQNKAGDGKSHMRKVWTYLEQFLHYTGCSYMLLVNNEWQRGGQVWIKKGFIDLRHPPVSGGSSIILNPFRFGFEEFALGYGEIDSEFGIFGSERKPQIVPV